MSEPHRYYRYPSLCRSPEQLFPSEAERIYEHEIASASEAGA